MKMGLCLEAAVPIERLAAFEFWEFSKKLQIMTINPYLDFIRIFAMVQELEFFQNVRCNDDGHLTF